MRKILCLMMCLVWVHAGAAEEKGLAADVLLRPDLVYGGYIRSDVVFVGTGAQYIATTGNGAALFDSVTGAELRTFYPAGGEAMAIDVNSTGTRLAMGTREGKLLIFSVTDGSIIHQIAAHTSIINDVSFSGNGVYVATASSDTRAKVYRVDNGAFVREFSHGAFVPLYAVAINAGALIATGGDDGVVRVWTIETGASTRTFPGHQSRVVGLDFSPDGLRIFSTAFDNTLRTGFIGAGTGGTLASLSSSAVDVKVSADGTKVLCSHTDGVPRIFDTAGGSLQIAFGGHTGTVMAGDISPDGQRIVTVSQDASVRTWNALTGGTIRSHSAHPGELTAMDITPDGGTVITAGREGTLRLWNAANGIYLGGLESNTSPTSVAVSPDGGFVLAGYTGNFALLYHLGTRTNVRGYGGHFEDVVSVAFSSDGAKVLTGSYDGTARIYDRETEAEERRFENPSGEVSAVAFSRDDAHVFTGDVNGNIIMWDVEDESIAKRFPQVTEWITSIVVSPDGTKLLVGTRAGVALLIDIERAQTLYLPGHLTASVLAVDISRDGTKMVTTAEDGGVRLWDTRAGVELRRYAGHLEPVVDVTFDATGSNVISASSNGEAHLWPTVPHCDARCEGQTADADADGIPDCLEDCIGTSPSVADTDGDGMPDLFEYDNYLSRLVPDDTGDKDADGLTNRQEYDLGLSPIDRDSDDDEMLDGFEVAYQLDPRTDDADEDADEDGLTNLEEQAFASSPRDADTDDDEMTDDYERLFNFNPVVPDGTLDSDNDDLTNVEEFDLSLDPRNNDTDGDNLFDGYEVQYDLNPYRADSWQDADGDGLTNSQEFIARTSPSNPADPPRPVRVSARLGNDDTGDGSEEKPFLTLTAALLDTARYSYFLPATVVAMAGTYEEQVEIPLNVTLEGVGAETVLMPDRGSRGAFVRPGPNTMLRNLRVSARDDAPLGIRTLVLLQQGPVKLEDLTITGNDEITVIGVLARGMEPGQAEITGCHFSNLDTGVYAVASSVNITRCLFEDINGRGVLAMPEDLKSHLSQYPQLGSASALGSTGFNRFRDMAGPAIEVLNYSGITLEAQYNDWGVYQADQVRELVSITGEDAEGVEVMVEPFIQSPLENGDVVIAPVSSETGTVLGADASAMVSISGVEFPVDASGLAIFQGLAPGLQSFRVVAELYCDALVEVEASPERVVAVAPALSSGILDGDECIDLSEGEGGGEEGEIEVPEADDLVDAFADLDANGDRALSYSEITQAMGFTAEQLLPLDTNWDGLLSMGELQLQVRGLSPIHSADTDGSHSVELMELLRVIQIFTAGGYACAEEPGATEDGYVLAGAGAGAPACRAHATDYRNAPDGGFDLTEVLRAVQLYNFGVIISCGGSADGFCDGD